MSLTIIRKIACEKDNSHIVPSSPRDELQKLRLAGLYELLVVLRIVLTLNFQTGWINQEEFSNSLEAVAGDYFDLQVFKSPAFNATFPTRSIPFIQSTIYIPYILGYFYTTFKDELGKESIPNSKLLILFPRLFYVAGSFLVDYLMVKFCKRNNQDHTIRLVTLASSQVLLIFASRTHSSSLSLIMFALLLYLISDSINRMDDYIPILTKYNRSKDPVERVNLLKEMRLSGFSTVGKLHWITAIIVIGFFNDPEFFLSYSAVPLVFYLQRGISNPHVGIKHFHARVFVFIAYFFTFSIPFVLWDSFYYEKVTIDDFRTLNLRVESFVVTPVNYFVEKKAASLRSLTSNPLIFGNFFIMYNVLGVVGLVSFGKDLYDMIFSKWSQKPKMGTQWTFLNASLFIPLFFLIPYRSPFDLVPLLFPLVYMHGHKIPLISRFNSKIGFSWFLLNLLSIIYFGYFCQGGIISSLLDLYTQLVPIRFNSTQVDIIFSQMTAIPPIFVLAIPSKWKTLVTAPTAMTEEELGIPSSLYKTVLKLDTSSKIRVFHTGVSPLPKSHLERDVSRIIQRNYHSSVAGNDKYDSTLEKVNLLVIPAADGKEVEEQFEHLKVTHVKTYWNHLWFSMWNEDGQKRPVLDLGLSLYRIEKSAYWKEKTGSNNVTLKDQKFKETFPFHDFFSELVSYIINGCSMLFTIVLFLMSYLVFLT